MFIIQTSEIISCSYVTTCQGIFFFVHYEFFRQDFLSAAYDLRIFNMGFQFKKCRYGAQSAIFLTILYLFPIASQNLTG